MSAYYCRCDYNTEHNTLPSLSSICWLLLLELHMWLEYRFICDSRVVLNDEWQWWMSGLLSCSHWHHFQVDTVHLLKFQNLGQFCGSRINLVCVCVDGIGGKRSVATGDPQVTGHVLPGHLPFFTARQSAVLAIVNPSVRPSVCPSVTRWHCVKTTPATIMGSSL